MVFSIIIPSVNNFDFLKFTIESIKKNSKFNHQIIASVIGEFSKKKHKDFFLKNNVIEFLNIENKGFCTSINNCLKFAANKFIVLSDDDMFYLPDWDVNLIYEIRKLPHKNFFLSSTMIENKKYEKKLFTKFPNKYPNHIYFNAGSSLEDFDEKKLMKFYKDFYFQDWNGTHHTPCVISKEIFYNVGGMSEEFNPASGSDPDLCMKLWNSNVRIFKGISKSRVYHFGSKTTRRGNIKMNNGHKTFLKKWGISLNFFIKHYLKRGTPYKGELSIDKNLSYYIDLFFCKLKLFLIK